MIQNFKDEATEDVFHGISSKKALKVSKDIWAVARRKLDMLNAAYEIVDLRMPPGNRLEKLKKELAEYHGIRINDQYRLVFEFRDGDAYEVEIIDYH